MHILYYLFISITLLTTIGCSQNKSPNNEENAENLKPSTISIRNPNIVIKKPVTFSWLPESNKLYEDYRLSKLPIRETIQTAIRESLTSYGYDYRQLPKITNITHPHIQKGTPVQPKDLVYIKNWEWAGPNFGAGGFLKEINLENRSNQNYRDIRMKIDYLGTKGPKEGYGGPSSIFVIHDLLPANSEKTFKDINIGFRHPDSRAENIRVLDAKAITHDLLIGYTLTIKRSLTDHDINRRFAIYPAPHIELEKSNIYEKGTLIIDIINANSRVLIWRGVIKSSVNLDLSDDKIVERIKLGVEKLIDNSIQSN
jgi:hypothetical protein